MDLAIQLTISALVLASVLTAGNGKLIAWPLLIAGQGLFLWYAIATAQVGFWPLNVGMMLAGGRNWVLWSRRRRASAADHAV